MTSEDQFVTNMNEIKIAAINPTMFLCAQKLLNEMYI